MMIMGLMWILISSATKWGLSPALAPFCKCRSHRVHKVRGSIGTKIRPASVIQLHLLVFLWYRRAFRAFASPRFVHPGRTRKDCGCFLLHSMAHYSIVRNSCAAVLLLVAFFGIVVCDGDGRANTDDVEFDVVFHQPTLGLELSPELVVIGFAKKSTTAHANVHVGDKIVAVNGQSLEGIPGIAASRLIKLAATPRKLTFRSTVKGLSRVIVDEEDLSASIEKRDHVQILSGTAAVLGDREEKGAQTDGPDTGISTRGVVGRLPFASALFGPTKTIDIGGKGSFAMDPAKIFHGASLSTCFCRTQRCMWCSSK